MERKKITLDMKGYLILKKKKRNKKNPPLNARSKNTKTNKQSKKHALAAQKKKNYINNTLKPLAAQKKNPSNLRLIYQH